MNAADCILFEDSIEFADSNLTNSNDCIVSSDCVELKSNITLSDIWIPSQLLENSEKLNDNKTKSAAFHVLQKPNYANSFSIYEDVYTSNSKKHDTIETQEHMNENNVYYSNGATSHFPESLFTYETTSTDILNLLSLDDSPYTEKRNKVFDHTSNVASNFIKKLDNEEIAFENPKDSLEELYQSDEDDDSFEEDSPNEDDIHNTIIYSEQNSSLNNEFSVKGTENIIEYSASHEIIADLADSKTVSSTLKLEYCAENGAKNPKDSLYHSYEKHEHFRNNTDTDYLLNQEVIDKKSKNKVICTENNNLTNIEVKSLVRETKNEIVYLNNEIIAESVESKTNDATKISVECSGTRGELSSEPFSSPKNSAKQFIDFPVAYQRPALDARASSKPHKEKKAKKKNQKRSIQLGHFFGNSETNDDNDDYFNSVGLKERLKAGLQNNYEFPSLVKPSIESRYKLEACAFENSKTLSNNSEDNYRSRDEANKKVIDEHQKSQSSTTRGTIVLENISVCTTTNDIITFLSTYGENIDLSLQKRGNFYSAFLTMDFLYDIDYIVEGIDGQQPFNLNDPPLKCYQKN